MINTRKLSALILALLMFLAAFAGVAGAAESNGSYEVYTPGDLLQITVDQIAELNHCEVGDLNITYDAEGRITFIGNRFSTEKVMNGDDACQMLTALLDLASIDVDLHYYDVSVSSVTGNRYYSFYQTEEIEPEPGVKVLIDTNAGCIKLITDREGNTIGLSSCAGGTDQVQTYPEETWVTREEALERVRRQLADGEHIIEELTDYAYLDDEGCIMACNMESKRLPVWQVVTDYSLIPGWNGTLYCISMVGEKKVNQDGTLGKSVKIAQLIPLRTPDSQGLEAAEGIYTSLAYFDNMEDAGSYTFRVDESNWVIDAREGYEFRQKEVTVPLMYDRAKEVYVLGDYENKLIVTDYFTYYKQASVCPNMLVSATPEDIGSWHWERPEVRMADGSSFPLFLNMEYALSSYDTLRKVHENYHRELGVDSYDGAGIPQMLLLYMTQGNSYPTNVSDFRVNANNYGIKGDWAIMGTSPCASYCADEIVLGHEYAHGIDRSNSALKFGNLTGCVEEAFADIMSLGVYNASHEADITKLPGDGEPADTFRDISDPAAFNMPRYMHDEFYMNEVDMSEGDVADATDYGGVHANSSVTTYLAWSVSPANKEIDGTPIEWKEIAQLFYEASFCRTTDFGYDELGAYLLFSADTLGLSEAKQNTLANYAKRYGFCADKTGLEQLLAGTGIPEITVTANMDDKIEGRTLLLRGNGCWGVFGKEPVTVRVSDARQQSRYLDLYSPYVYGKENRRELSIILERRDVLLQGNVAVDVYTVMVEPGNHVNFPEEVYTMQENVVYGRIALDDTMKGATVLKPCEILISGMCCRDGLNLYHIICGSPEEIHRELDAENVPKTLEQMAFDGERHKVPFTIINELDCAITDLYIAQPSDDKWGANLFQAQPLQAGGVCDQYTFTFNSGSLVWEFKVITEGGSTWNFGKTDFSSFDPERGVVLRFYWGEQGEMMVRYR